MGDISELIQNEGLYLSQHQALKYLTHKAFWHFKL